MFKTNTNTAPQQFHLKNIVNKEMQKNTQILYWRFNNCSIELKWWKVLESVYYSFFSQKQTNETMYNGDMF